MELTQDEKQFILNLLTNLTLNPAQQDASAVVQMVQALVKKLGEKKNNVEQNS